VVYGKKHTSSPVIRLGITPSGIQKLMAGEITCGKVSPEVPPNPNATGLLRLNA
jgi:hypothetical protein